MNGYIDTIRAKIGHDSLMLVGAGVFVYRDGKMLLQRRKDDGTWADHGGCLELGETLEDTARRELLEETGLSAGKLTLIGAFSGPGRMHVYPNGDRAYMIGVYYLCEDFTGELIPQADEVTDLRWFPLDALPADILHLSREPLQKCLEILRGR